MTRSAQAVSITSLISIIPADDVVGVRAWLGIPYGKAPTGDLRFSPPVAPDPWTTPLNANAFGPACIQSRLTAVIAEEMVFPFPESVEESEDCVCPSIA